MNDESSDNDPFESIVNGVSRGAMDEAAIQLHEMFRSLTDSGFTVDQALYLVSKMMAPSDSFGESDSDSGDA